jgi:hypothetical protein
MTAVFFNPYQTRLDRKPRFRIVDSLAETLRDHYARFISDPMETVATDWREWFQGTATNE